MSETLANIAVTSTWQNLVTTHASLGGADARIQNIGAADIDVVHGGSTPTTATGDRLGTLDSTEVNASAVWVRAVGGRSTVSITLL